MGFDIDEAVNDQNWKKESFVSLRLATENDLDEIFNLIQTVGKKMECKDNELFAYSKNPATYLQMLKTGVCAVAVRNNNEIIASLLTRPEDNRDGVFDLTGISKEFMPNTIEFVTCQVLEEYRGNKLEQKLIDFVLMPLNKLACYKYAICTISPDNAASLKSVKNNSFRVCNTAKLYGGKMRYVLMRELGMDIHEPTSKFENISGNALIKDLQNKYDFCDTPIVWIDNLHSAIKYIREYGKDVKLRDIPFYVVDISDYDNPSIHGYKGSLRERYEDILGAISCAYKRFRRSNSKELIEISYTLRDFLCDNPMLYTELNTHFT